MEVYNINKECLKDEFLLHIDDVNGKIAHCDELKAFARLVQRIIIMRPMSYPDEPEMGVGIADYEFEFMDKITLNAIGDKIRSQITKYIPNSNVGNIIVDTIYNEKEKRKNTIGVLINLVRSKENKENMILTFEKVEKTGKVESKIYL